MDTMQTSRLSPGFKRSMTSIHCVSPNLLDLAESVLEKISPIWMKVDSLRDLTTLKVLEAFQASGVSDHNLHGSTGYGYADSGRDACEAVYARYFGTEAALVRPQIASGTHALTCCLFGSLRPGDELVSLAGPPYDTMQKVIGSKPGAMGSLAEFGIRYSEVPVGADGYPDEGAIRDSLARKPKMVLLQRSRGYSTRPSISVERIGGLIDLCKAISPETIFFVDNCYGEFVEAIEPTHLGADLMAGSLIKNPGGTLAPTGGYIVGNRDLVEAAASRLTAPGVGSAIGATLDLPRTILHGFFLAPGITAEAVKGAIFVSELYSNFGFPVQPGPGDPRTDIVQSIEFGEPELLISFCQGLQKASPVDSFVVPEPWEMPGYSDQVIMAGGTFVSGSSIEMSADGAMRPPYMAYYQGGVSASQVLIGAVLAADRMLKAGLLPGLSLEPR